MTRITADWLTADPSQRICALLNDAGFQALFVGGCVRNALLDAPVSDLDISTNARPDTVMALAKAAGIKAIPTGIDHGTVTLILKGAPFEITTFRRDVETDGRRAVVAFADDINDDARRRDFTMNALYAGADGRVLDPLGGLPDLHARRVRFIEDANQRIKEDYLRILRFFRFHAWYGADGIDPEGLAACAENTDGIDSLSAERLGQEMLKLLSAPDPAPAVAAMAACGALARVIPGANATLLAPLVHMEDQTATAPDPIRRLAAIGGEDVAQRLRLSKAQARRLALLSGDPLGPGEMAYRHGHDAAIDRILIEASVTGLDPKSMEMAQKGADARFPIKAADLPHLKGPALGEALKSIEARWIATGFTLTKDALLA